MFFTLVLIAIKFQTPNLHFLTLHYQRLDFIFAVFCSVTLFPGISNTLITETPV